MERLYANLLGSFALYREPGGPIISEEKSTSKILWTFLQYLLVFHHKEVSQEELIDVLWGDSPSANPANTLKTMLHRSRLLLEELGFSDGKQVLLYRRGIYSWAPDLELILDIEQFDTLYTAAERSLDDRLSAIQIYKGDFLPKAAGTPWAISLRTYYHGRYLKLCRDMASALLQRRHFDQVIEVCKKAILVDPYDESCHLMLMKALDAIGEQQSALQHYNEMADLFMTQLGATPSKESRDLYRELLKSCRNAEADLHAVRERLLEKSPLMGAFYCDFEIFQDIYRIEARNAIRSGESVQLIMLTATLLSASSNQAHLNAVMQDLSAAVQRSLRAGDIFTRFSGTQLLLLTPTASRENGVKIVNRILETYQSTLSGRTTRVDYSLLPVLPVQRSEP